MLTQREKALISAFQKIGNEQQDYYFDAICDCAREMDESRPPRHLKLVASNTALPSVSRFDRLIEGS